MTNICIYMENIDHKSGNFDFQISDSITVYRIRSIRQSVVKVLLGFDPGENHIENRGFVCKLTDSVQLHNLEQNSCDHGDGCLSVGQDLAPRFRGDAVVDYFNDGALFKVVFEDRGKADALSGYIVNNIGNGIG